MTGAPSAKISGGRQWPATWISGKGELGSLGPHHHYGRPASVVENVVARTPPFLHLCLALLADFLTQRHHGDRAGEPHPFAASTYCADLESGRLARTRRARTTAYEGRKVRFQAAMEKMKAAAEAPWILDAWPGLSRPAHPTTWLNGRLKAAHGKATLRPDWASRSPFPAHWDRRGSSSGASSSDGLGHIEARGRNGFQEAGGLELVQARQMGDALQPELDQEGLGWCRR